MEDQNKLDLYINIQLVSRSKHARLGYKNQSANAV
jgi:hypothetical protein